MGVVFEGFAGLQADLQAMDISAETLKPLVEEAAIPMAASMRQNAPVGSSGELRNSIGVGPAKVSGSVVSITVGSHRKDWTGGDEYYPPYVEYGHAGPHGGKETPPHPYIRPTYDAGKDDFVDRLRAKVKLRIKWR